MQASDGNFYTSPTNAFYLFRVTPTGQFSNLKGQLDPSCGSGIGSGGWVEGPDGSLYAISVYGGSDGSGVFFKYSLTSKTCSPIYTFPGGMTATLSGPLTLGSDGNFYGLSHNYGAYGYGYAFSLSPTGAFKDIYDFGALSNSDDGSLPAGSLLEGSDGNWYGTTSSGGTSSEGLLFQLTPGVTTPWVESQFIDFAGQVGTNPVGPPVEWSDGNVYGVNASSGPNGYGAIYQTDLLDNNPDSTYIGIKNPQAFPVSGGPVLAGDGQFYVIESSGPGAIYGGLEVFNLSSQAQTPLGTFTSATSSLLTPTSSFVQGADGNFYGLATSGGANNAGGWWKAVVTPAVPPMISVNVNTTAPASGKPVKVSWSVANVNSKTAAQCYAYANIVQSGYATPTQTGGNWSGKLQGTITSGVMSGTASVTATASGVYTYAVECQGRYAGVSPQVTVSGVSSVTTATSLTANPNPVNYGSQVSLTATVTKTSGPGTPSGSVTYRVGSTNLATVNLNNSGVAVLTANATGYSTGTYPVVAYYNGDSSDLASQSPVVNVKLVYASTTTLTASPNPVTRPASITITATVTGSQAKPGGSVSFYASGELLTTVNLVNGTAAFTATTGGYPAGMYSLTARYNGSSLYNSSTSTALSVQLK